MLTYYYLNGERCHAFDSLLVGLTYTRGTGTDLVRSFTVSLVSIAKRLNLK